MAASTGKSKFSTDPYGIIERGPPSGGSGPSFSVGRVGSPVASLASPGRTFGTGVGGTLKFPVGKNDAPAVKKKANGGKAGCDMKKPVKKAVGGVGKLRKGMCDKPEKLAKGGAGKVRKGMMTPEGKIIDVMNKIRGK